MVYSLPQQLAGINQVKQGHITFFLDKLCLRVKSQLLFIQNEEVFSKVVSDKIILILKTMDTSVLSRFIQCKSKKSPMVQISIYSKPYNFGCWKQLMKN